MSFVPFWNAFCLLKPHRRKQNTAKRRNLPRMRQDGNSEIPCQLKHNYNFTTYVPSKTV